VNRNRNWVAFGAGGLFSAGLSIAGMTRPSKVIGFLDVFGHWDPSLALVMASAVAVSALAFRASRRRSAAPFSQRSRSSSPTPPIDRRLVAGAAIFGVGWGLSGLCPGPAVVSLAGGRPSALVFVVSMLLGMAMLGATDRRHRTSP
jgi:uncharacterized protein